MNANAPTDPTPAELFRAMAERATMGHARPQVVLPPAVGLNPHWPDLQAKLQAEGVSAHVLADAYRVKL